MSRLSNCKIQIWFLKGSLVLLFVWQNMASFTVTSTNSILWYAIKALCLHLKSCILIIKFILGLHIPNDLICHTWLSTSSLDWYDVFCGKFLISFLIQFTGELLIICQFVCGVDRWWWEGHHDWFSTNGIYGPS